MTKKKEELVILLAILIIATFFRFYNLNSVPPLYHDEAMNGNDVIQAMDSGTYPQVFYPNNSGREGLFINIQGLFVKMFGHKPWSLRAVSSIFGVLTVWGLYLLAKKVFDHNIAALSSFFLAISFWHVNFSHLGFRAIMLPFILVFEFYFLWRAFESKKIRDFIVTGVFAGLGLHTYISYRVSFLVVAFVFLASWFYVKKSPLALTGRPNKWLLKGFAVLVVTTIIVASPLLLYFLAHPDEFISHKTDVSIWGTAQPLYNLFKNLVKTFGMFNFNGDFIWRHNISRSPQLVLPIGILFIIGFIKELIYWLKIKNEHFSPTHALLFSWFFVMLLPGFFSVPAPHALRTIGVIPVVMIFAGMGLWWLYDKFYNKLTIMTDHNRGKLLSRTILIVFLISLTLIEFWRYQIVWGQSIKVYNDFKREYVNIADFVKTMPVDIPKYIVVNVSGVLVPIPNDPRGRSMPVPAQTVMFLTDTFSYRKQVEKKLFYLTVDEFNTIGSSQKDAVVIYFKSVITGNKETYYPVILSNSSDPKTHPPKTYFILLGSVE